jgi:hypothetical protein
MLGSSPSTSGLRHVTCVPMLSLPVQLLALLVTGLAALEATLFLRDKSGERLHLRLRDSIHSARTPQIGWFLLSNSSL